MVSSDLGTARFTALSEGLADILRKGAMEVPIYQRSYAWELEQVEQFWNDLRAAMAIPNPEYFMGTFVLTLGSEGRTTIIDGQQRLATTALLLACFRDFLVEVKDNNRASTIESEYLASRDLGSGQIEPRLLLNRDDRGFFSAYLQGAPASRSIPETDSNKRIAEAFDFLSQQVRAELRAAGPNWTSRLVQWIDFVKTRVQIIVVRVNNDADAFLIFETLNDRGLVLTIADLLKNYLFGLAGDLLDIFETSWLRTISSFDAPAEEAVVTTFLRHYWSSLHGAVRERDLYRRIRSEIRSQQQAFDLVADLEVAATNYAALLSSQHERWNELGIPVAEVETLLRFGLEQYRPLLLAAMQVLPTEEVHKLIRAISSWSVRGLIAGGIGGGTTERYYSEAAVSIRDGAARTSAEVYEALQPIIQSDVPFQTAFSSRRVSNPRLARYYLLALENFYQGKPDPFVVSGAEAERYRLVRVLPRRADWNDWPHFDPGEVGQASLRLGNAVIFSESDSLPAEHSFDAIRLAMEQSSVQLTQRASMFEGWTPEVIEERQDSLSRMAFDIWPRVPVS